MADTQTASSSTNGGGSLPIDLLNPPDMQLITGSPVSPTARSSLPPSYTAPPPTPQPAPPAQPPTTIAPPTPLPAPAPAPTPTPAAAPAAAPAQPAAPAAAGAPAPSYVAVGDSLAAGMAHTKRFNQTYDVNDEPAARANPGILAASGRTTDQTLSAITANPQQFAGKEVILSTGMSNDLKGGRPLDDAMTNVASQLDALSKAGAKVALVGVGSGVTGYQAANARLKQIADAYHIPFTGEPATTQGGRVHPSDYNAVFGQFNFGEQQQQPPGTAKTIDDVTATIQKAEGGGDFILFGHEGTPYDPKTMPTKPGYFGFPDWAGGYGSNGRQTHAAGGAQWEPDTWKNAVEGFTQAGLANQLGHTPDFRNPADQKAVFNYWAARRYKELTGRDIVADDNAGHVDWAALGPEWESLKSGLPGGGGTAGMTVGNLPGYQQYAQLSQQQRDLLQQEIGTMQKSIAGMDAGDPKQRALADQLMQKQLQLMDKYEDMIAHPPTQKPHDMISNFGSIATLIGIFAGRFAHRPMVASLNAAGAAMQAMNDNDHEQYQNAFNQWKTQAGMTSTLLGMESSAYKGIMEDKRLDMDEKFKLLDAQMKMYQNAQGMIASEQGDLDKQWEIAEKTQQLKDQHDLHVQQITEANDKAQQAQSLQAATQADDQKWITDNPDAYQAWIKDNPERAGTVPPEVHFDNLTKRQGQARTATKTGTAEAVQVTWPDGQTEVLYGQRGAPGHFVTEGGRDVDLSTAKTVLPMTKSQAGGEAIALPDYKGPAEWEGMPSTPPPGIDKGVWSMAVDWVRTGKPPPGIGRLDQVTREKLQQAYPVAQQALGIKPEDEYTQQIKFAAEKARMESIERSFGSGIQGRNLVSLNTVADHIQLFRQYADALRNHDTQRINQLQNRLATEAGSPEIIQFALAATITGDEVVRLLTTTGGTVTDREDIAKRLASYDSPAQLQGAADTLTAFVRSRYEPLRQQYSRGDPEREHYFDQNMVTPEARQMFTGPAGATTPPTPTPTPTTPAAPGATTTPTPTPSGAATAQPQWATGSATGPNGAKVFTDGKGWFHADHTPVQ